MRLLANLKTLILCLTLFFWANLATAQDLPLLNDANLNDLKSTTEFISKECPKENCLILFPGRSMTLHSAYLKANGIQNYLHLPVSGLNFSISSTDERIAPMEKKFHQFILKPLLTPELDDHLRRIVVIDYSLSGTTLARTSVWIKNFLMKTPHQSISVEALAYSHSNLSELSGSGVGSHLKKYGVTLNVFQDNLIRRIGFSEFQNFAPFKSWPIEYESQTPVIDPNQRYDGKVSYNELVDHLKNLSSCNHALGGK